MDIPIRPMKSLPNETYYLILKFVKHVQLRQMVTVCQLFNSILAEEYFWKEKFRNDCQLLLYDHPVYKGLERYNYHLYMTNVQRGSEKFVDLAFCLETAIRNNQYLLTQYFLDVGATRTYNSFFIAAKTNDIMAIELLKGLNPLSDKEKGAILTGAIYGNHETLFESYIGQLSAKISMDDAFYYIGTKGSLLEVSKLLKKIEIYEKLDLTNYESGLIGAVESGNLNLVEVFINIGASNIHAAAKASIMSDHLDILKFLVEHHRDAINIKDLYYSVASASSYFLEYLFHLPDEMSSYNLFCGFLEAGEFELAKIIENTIDLTDTPFPYNLFEDLETSDIDVDVVATEKSLINMGLYHGVKSGNPKLLEHYIERGGKFCYPILSRAIDEQRIDIFEIIVYLINKYPGSTPCQSDWDLIIQEGLSASNNKTFIEYIAGLYLY